MAAEPEVIDIEEVPESAVARIDVGIAATGALALAALSEDEFNRRLTALEVGRGRVERIQKALMTLDVDYGVIPGTRKPTLYKPGAEMLCQAYSLAADFLPVRTLGDGIVAPSISYLTRCDLHLGSLDGPVIAVGYGACNSWETRYRYRRGERICPNCGKPAIIKGKAEYGGGWVCFKKKDGCGSKWRDGAPEIEGQSVGDVENPDPFDLDVVLAKMAEKRAHIDATLRATNASRLFTQDVEDLARPPDPDPSRVDQETGEVLPAPPAAPPLKGETETLLGELGRSRAGTIAKTKSRGSDLEARETPEGTHIGFKFDTPKGAIEEVWATGDVAAFLFAASSMDYAKLEGEHAVVNGLLYRVTEANRRTKHRLKLSAIEVLGAVYPSTVPTEFPAKALLDAEDAADLDALDVPWPDTVGTPA